MLLWGHWILLKESGNLKRFDCAVTIRAWLRVVPPAFLGTRDALRTWTAPGNEVRGTRKSRDKRNYPGNDKFREMPLPGREGPYGGLGGWRFLMSEVTLYGTDPSELRCLSLQG